MQSMLDGRHISNLLEHLINGNGSLVQQVKKRLIQLTVYKKNGLRASYHIGGQTWLSSLLWSSANCIHSRLQCNVHLFHGICLSLIGSYGKWYFYNILLLLFGNIETENTLCDIMLEDKKKRWRNSSRPPI